MVAHFGGAAAAFLSSGWLGWVPPLIAMMTQGAKSPTARAQAVEALNHQLTWAIASITVWILGICGSFIIVGALLFFLLPITVLVPVIFGVIAGVKTNNGEAYRYPATIRMIK